MSGEVSLDDYHFLNLTGGFLDGDDLGSAKAQATSSPGTDAPITAETVAYIDIGTKMSVRPSLS